jgi:hypothetical protein
MKGVYLDPPRDGEGDHAQHGGGGPSRTLLDRSLPSVRPSACHLPVPGRI